MGSGKIYTIIEEELVANRIDKAADQHPGIVKLYDAILWMLARDPFTGTKLEHHNPEQYILKTPFWGPGVTPASITLVYRVTAQEVIIEASRIQWINETT